MKARSCKCKCCSLRVGGVIIGVLELVGSILCVILSLFGFIGSLLVDVVDKIRSYDEGNAHVYVTPEEEDFGSFFLAGRAVFGVLCAIGLIGIISSIILLFGIVKFSVMMMKTWILIRTVWVVISMGITVEAFASQYIVIECLVVFSIVILLEIIAMLIVWALVDKTKAASNAVLPP